MKETINELVPVENPLFLEGDGYRVILSPSAQKVKFHLLDKAKDILTVTDNDSALIAKSQRDDINKMLIEVEKTRKLVKQPVIDKGKEIDQLASTFTMDLTVEKIRLDKLIGNFALAQEKIRREAAERAMREAAERERLQREADEAEQRAERLRLGAEQAAAEAESRKERQAAEQARLQAEAEQVRASDLAHAAGVSGMQAHAASMVVYDNARVKGASVGLDFDLVDVHALYSFNRNFVELTPKRREILRLLASNQELGIKTVIPGLLIKEVARVR